jgi:hypothetical protein
MVSESDWEIRPVVLAEPPASMIDMTGRLSSPVLSNALS